MADDGQFDFEALDENDAEANEQEKDNNYEIFDDDEGGVSGASFGSLRPQYIDVLSDWGETEKFIIDGDSLLLHAMREQNVDWQHGGQFLHLSYGVEVFLQALLSRGGLFCVAFFESHSAVWPSASFLMARSLLIAQLKSSLPPAAASVACFDSPYTDEWADFISTFQPAVLAVADAPPLGCGDGGSSFPLLRFSQTCWRSGVHLLILRDVELSESVLRGFYVKSRASTLRSATWLSSPAPAPVSRPSPNAMPVDAFKQAANWRLAASAWACKVWLEGHSSAAEEQVAKAMVVQAAMLSFGSISLQQRARLAPPLPSQLTSSFLSASFECLSVSEFADAAENGATAEDRADLFDGRLYMSLLGYVGGGGGGDAASFGLDAAAASAAESAWQLCSSGSPLFPLSKADGLVEGKAQGEGGCEDGAQYTLIKVSGCSLIDSAMRVHPGHVQVDASQDNVAADALSGLGWDTTKATDESFLWTHCRDQSANAEPTSRNMSEWERRRAMRRKARQSQMYFRHLHEYAASLAGTTVLGAAAQSGGSQAGSAASTPRSTEAVKGDNDDEVVEAGGKGGKGGKGGGKKEKAPKEKKLSKKEQMLADILAKKQKGVTSKLDGDWKELQGAISSSTNYVAKIKDLDDFTRKCVAADQQSLALEVRLQRLEECKDAWQEDKEARNDNMKFAIMTFETVRDIMTRHADLVKDPASPVAASARTAVIQTMAQLGFVDAAQKIAADMLDSKHKKQKEEFEEEAQDLCKTFRSKLSVYSKSSPHFQLQHLGHLLPRPPPKIKDPRITTFTPDEWQRELLDAVDNRDSVLVCAPTSSGKTFISHYCMDKVMHDTRHKDGVVVFVAPTKALINQIAAQVYGSFHSAFGIYTDAYRHRALTCRILITVPECLESLLMSPVNAAWAQRIRYVILDEIHCISSAEEGKVWEHVLLLLNAPFVALSATVGQPETFVKWLQSVKDAQRESDNGASDESYAVRLVQHSERFVDLRRHIYVGKPSWGADDAKGAAKAVGYAKLHLRARVDHTSSTVEGADHLETLHPLVSFTSSNLSACEIPQNLKFEPKDSLAVVNAMQDRVRRAGESSPLADRAKYVEALDPVNYFASGGQFIIKPDAVQYEVDVKAELTSWMRSGLGEHVVAVLKALGNSMVADSADGDDDEDDDEEGAKAGGTSAWMDRLFHLMCVLHRQDRLPAVVFNFDRNVCEKIAMHFNALLQGAEDAAREEHGKELNKSQKVADAKEKMQKRARDKVVSEKKEIEMLDEMADMQESAAFDTSILDEATFKAQFSFVQEGRGSQQDFERITESARKVMGEGHPLIQILRHGIGVHHNGLQNKYKMAVEMLFRCGYLRIVISTETLAYGINMPARTVVFAGDSISLNSVQYQQMSGRAGRRGLDVLGHIVMFEVPRYKLHRLIVSPVPRLRGHIPTPASLVQRLLSLWSNVGSQRGVNAAIEKRVHAGVARCLQMPLYFSDKPELAPVFPLQARIGLDLLVRFGLVSADGGRPAGLAPLSDHLHFSDPGNFALVALLQSGALHSICKQSDDRNWEAVARDLLTTLAHLFCRVRLHPDAAPTTGGVVLPPLPPACKDSLDAHNAAAFSALNAMAVAGGAAVAAEGGVLPLSQASVEGKGSGGAFGSGLTGGDADSGVSSFARLSGNGGGSERGLGGSVACARPEACVHHSACPVLSGIGEGQDNHILLNGYIVDFFSHSNFGLIIKDNGVPSGAAWQGLRNFQLILASIAKNVAAIAPESDIVSLALARLEQEFSAKFFAKLYK